MSAAYDRSARMWLSGPEPIYRHFARALVRAAPRPLAGLRILDLGAGTGTVSKELRRVGACPVAVDASPAMLKKARGCVPELPVVASEALRLPVAGGSFDGSVSGFLLNHVPQPHRLLVEAARVTRRGGVLLAMTFAAGDLHPATKAVEGVAAAWGWQAPAWYHDQRSWAALTDTHAGLRTQAERACLPAVEVFSIEVDVGLLIPLELVSWRLGHAHMADFAMALSASDLRRLMAEAEAALGPSPQRLCRQLLILSSHLPA